MVRQDVNPEERSIRASNFGGLNKTTSPINIQVTDATELQNIDTDISGSLTKRLGTFKLFDNSNSNPYYTKNINTNNGIDLLVVVNDNDLIITWVNNNAVSTLRTFSNVFKNLNTDPYFVSIPGEIPRLLMLMSKETPVQLETYEYFEVVTSAGATIDIEAGTEIIVNSTAAGNAVVFINGVYDSGATVTYNASYSRVTPTSSLSVGDEVIILYFAWQWWAEAEVWRGDNFHKQVPRFGSSEADRLVLVPSSIYSDLRETSPPYGIVAAFHSTEDERMSDAGGIINIDDALYTYATDFQPNGETEYSFSNGQVTSTIQDNSDNFTTPSIIPSPFAVLFGDFSNPIRVDYDQRDINQDGATNGSIVALSHGFKAGDFVRLNRPNDTSPYSLTVLDDGRFIEAVSDDEFGVNSTSFDDLTYVQLVSVNTTTGLITVAANDAPADGATIRFSLASIPGGLSTVVTYWVNNQSTSTFFIYLEPSRTNRVIPTTSTTGFFRAWPVEQYFVEKIPYDNVFFIRMRALSFNDYNGSAIVDGSANTLVQYSVDGDWDNASTEVPLFDLAGGQDGRFFGITFAQSSTITFNTTTTANQTHYTFLSGKDTSSSPYTGEISKQTEDSLCRIVHTNIKWSGSNAKYEVFQKSDQVSHEGGAYPVYGLGLYANYNLGIFPTVGTLHQERLFLGGFRNKPNTLVASAIADIKVKDEYYNYFQVTDDLENVDSDPFDIVLDGESNALINGFVSWQQLLFVFTEDLVYRSLNVQSILSPSNRNFIIISNTGLISKNATSVSDNQIFYLSSDGLYDLPIIFENEYRSEELSLKVRPLINGNTDHYSLCVYDKRYKRLYVALESSGIKNKKLYVYDVRLASWTEYYSYDNFLSWSGTEYVDDTLGRQLCLSVGAVRYQGLLKFNHDKLLDYCQNYLEGVTAQTDLIFDNITPTSSQRTIKAPTIRWSPFIDVEDILIQYDNMGTPTNLVFDTDYTKVDTCTIRLTDTGRLKVSDDIWIIPNPEWSWYGTGVYGDSIAARIDSTLNDFGTLDVTSPTGYNYDTHDYTLGVDYTGQLHPTLESGPREAVTTVGYTYPCYYKSSTISLETLYINKTFSELILWFSNFDEQLDEATLGALGQNSATSFNSLQYISNIDVGIFHDMKNDGTVIEQIFDDSANVVDQLTEYTIFKERIPQNALAINVVLYSNNNFHFKCDAWQVNLQDASGTGFVSGVR